MTLSSPARSAIATAGLAITMSLTALTGSAAAQITIGDPHHGLDPLPQPIVQPIVSPCSQIASFSPASARPGQDVDIHITPPSGRASFGYSVTGVRFATGVAATFTNVAAHHVRAKVPVGSSAGPLSVTCRSPLTGGTWSIASATAFTPISFGNTLTPSTVNLLVGTSTNVTATLSHPAPEPITLTLAPQSNGVSVRGLAPGTSGTVTIPTGQQTATFSVGAHQTATLGGSVTVSGPNVAGATLTVTVPTPGFNLSTPVDAEVHWGDAAAYAVQVSSVNNFAGTVTLSASGLPFGATAAPVSVSVPAGGSATATVSVATAQAATGLGPDSFTLRGASPGVADDTSSADLRVLPDEGNFGGLSWNTTSSTCGSFEADVVGTNITFDGPGFSRTQPHTHLRYAWTPGCKGAVVMGASVGQNGGWPMSIFNFGFDTAIADGPGSRYNLGAAAWNHTHFKASSDGSFVIGVAQDNNHDASLYNMLSLSKRGATDSYSLVESLSASIVGDEVQARPSGNSNDWEWTLP